MQNKTSFYLICFAVICMLSLLYIVSLNNPISQQHKQSAIIASSDKNDSDTYVIRSESCFVSDLSDPKEMATMSQYIAIAKIDSKIGRAHV